MLYYDPSESGLPDSVIAYGNPCCFLEETSGADMLITSATFPCTTTTLLRRHLDCNAILVQRKSGNDFINSLGSRLSESIARMVTITSNSNQRILLYTGVFSEENGKLVLNGRVTHASYMSFIKSVDWFHHRGGKSVNLANDDLILQWIMSIEKDLEVIANKLQTDVYPTHDYPPDEGMFQVPVEVRDWRVTLATFPGIGPEKCNVLFNHLREKYGKPVSLLVALHYVMQNENKVHGWGKVARQSVMHWLGIEKVSDLSFEYQFPRYAKNIGGKIIEIDEGV